MHFIQLDSETDFEGWRDAARTLALNGVKPSDVIWSVAGDAPELFEPSASPLEPLDGTFSVSARFVELAQIAILHCDGERFAILTGCCGGCAAIMNC
jgi:uracil-DNA glycosylase